MYIDQIILCVGGGGGGGIPVSTKNIKQQFSSFAIRGKLNYIFKYIQTDELFYTVRKCHHTGFSVFLTK